MAPVRALFATAKEEGLVRSNPCEGLRLAVRRQQGEDDDGELKALTEEQLAAVLARLPEAWQLFFTFLAETGLRIGEAIELRWRDLEPGGKLRVRRVFYEGNIGAPKSNYARRTIKLTPEMTRALWHARGDANDDDLVWRRADGTRIVQSRLLADVLKPAATRAGVGSWVSFHTFRHTNATILFRRGWNAVQVQRWLGHHSPAFTLERYVHLLESDMPDPVSLAVASVNSSVNQTAETDCRTNAADYAAERLSSTGVASVGSQ